MCQKDFDLGLVRSVGKMERRRETRKSHGSSGSNSFCDAADVDSTTPRQHQQSSQQRYSSSYTFPSKRNTSKDNMMISSSSSSLFLEKNSLEDGSQGSEISGFDHQLPSLEKRGSSSCDGRRCNSFKSSSSSGGVDGDATFTTVAGCLSCSRQRRDDYGGNDFGECHQHQLYQKQEEQELQQQKQQEKKICRRQVVAADRAFSSSLHTSPFNSTYNDATTAGDIDTPTFVASSDRMLQHHLYNHHNHQHQNTSSSVCPSSMSGNTSQNVKTCRQQEHQQQQQQRFFSGLSRAIWIQLGMLILFSLNLQGVSAVRINSLTVPHVVRNGTVDSVILDCDYSIEDHEKKGLVVKWYFTNKQTQVYQWIPNSKPTSLGILKGKLNLDYQAVGVNNKMKSALQIIQPTTELSGNWICHVSTFEGDALEAGRMIVFAPEKEMDMRVSENRRGNYVNVSCWASRVFPKPKMTFYNGEQEVPDVSVYFDEYDGAYDVRASKIYEDTTLSSMMGSVFDCELAIPSTNYIRRKTTVFEPGSQELKDAMRMSTGKSTVSWDMTRFFIPLTTMVALTLVVN